MSRSQAAPSKEPVHQAVARARCFATDATAGPRHGLKTAPVAAAVGLVSAVSFAVQPSWLVLTLAWCLALVALWLWSAGWWWAAAWLVLGLCLGASLVPATPHGLVEHRGIVRQQQLLPWGQWLRVDDVFVSAPAQPLVQVGDRLRVAGSWRTQPFAIINATEVAVLMPRQERWIAPAWQVVAQAPHRDALAALVLGGGRPATRADFANAGLLHVLAVSGLHVGLVLGLIALLMRTMSLSDGWRQSLLIGAASCFAVLAGLGTPVVRAATMVTVQLLSARLGRLVPRLVPLALAVIGLVVWRPQQVTTPGFQLSVLAMLGIVGVGMRWVRWRQRVLPLQPWPLDRPSWRLVLGTLRWSCDGVLIGAAASLAIAPVTAHWFSSIAPFSALTTVMVMPLLTVALAAGVLAVAIGAVLPALTGPLLICWDLSWSVVVVLVQQLAAMPGATVSCAGPDPATVGGGGRRGWVYG